MYKWIVAAAKTSLGSPHFRRAVGGAFLLLATRQSTFAMRWMTPNRCRARLFLPVPEPWNSEPSYSLCGYNWDHCRAKNPRWKEQFRSTNGRSVM